MSRLHFRDATAADLPFIIGLIVEDAKVATGDDPAATDAPSYRDALFAINADPNQRVVVAELDGAPVATLQLTFIPGLAYRGAWRCLVEAVHVAPEHRSQGLGGEMMQWAIAQARARNCRMVQLTSNKLREDAHRFYVRLGFQQSHEGFKLYL